MSFLLPVVGGVALVKVQQCKQELPEGDNMTPGVQMDKNKKVVEDKECFIMRLFPNATKLELNRGAPAGGGGAAAEPVRGPHRPPPRHPNHHQVRPRHGRGLNKVQKTRRVIQYIVSQISLKWFTVILEYI